MNWRYYTNRRHHGWMRPAGIPEQTVTAVTLSATPTLPAAEVAQQPVAVTLTTTPTFPAARLDLDLTAATLTATPSQPAASLLAGSFPSIPSGAAGYGFSAETTNTTTHDVVVPTTINAGDLLLVFVGQDGAQDPDLSGAGFTQLRRLVGPSSLCLTEVWGKVATGSETDFTYPITNNEQSQNHCIRVIDWSGSLAGVEVSTGATGTSTTPDADALNPSGWGTEDTLWLTFFCQNDANAVGTAPTDYATIGSSAAGSAGSVNTHLAKRENAVASEDPGAFGATGASDAWAAVTVAVRPVVAAQSITAVTLSATPTLPAADVNHRPAAVTLTVTPSLPAAALAQALTAATLTATPSLPAATLSTSLTAVTLDTTPSLPAGTITAAANITAVTLTVPPTLPAARVDHSLTAVVLTVTPSQPAATLTAATTVTAVTLTNTPTFPQATIATGPVPTLRGVVESGTAQSSYTLSPSSTCVGSVALHVGASVSSVGVPTPTITGGGSVSWSGPKIIGNEGQLRCTYIFQGSGTFDGTDITIDFGSSVDQCTAHLVDWADAKASKPFIKFTEVPLPASNTATQTIYQQRRAHANNAVCVFLGRGRVTSPGDTGTVWDEGTELRDSVVAGVVLATSTVWHSTDFSNFDVVGSWDGPVSNFSLQYEVQAAASDDASPADVRHVVAGADASGDITVAGVTPKANEVLVFAAVGERAADSQDFTSVSDGTNSYSKVAAVNVDADHRLHVWAFRYGASPGSNLTITADHPVALIGSVYWLVGLRNTFGTGNTDWADTPTTNTASAATSISASMSGVGSDAGVLAFVGRDSSTEDFVVEQGFIPLGRDDRAGVGSETESLLAFWLGGDEDTTPSLTCSSGDLAIVALEVLAAVTQLTAVTLSATPSLPQASTRTDLTAVTLAATPSLPAASLATSITAATLTATPTLPAASVVTASQIAAIALEVTPTLPQASVQVASIAAQTLTATPSLPQASLATSLSAQVLTATPTQPPATLRTDVGAVVLTVTPTQPAASLRTDVAAQTLTATPTLPAATIAADVSITAQTLTVSPTFPQASAQVASIFAQTLTATATPFPGEVQEAAPDEVLSQTLLVTPTLPPASLTQALAAQALNATPTFPTASIGTSLTAGTLVLSPVLPAAHLAQDAEVQALTLILGPTLPVALVVQGALGEAPGRGPTSVSGRSGTGVRGRTSTSTRGDLTTTGVR